MDKAVWGTPKGVEERGGMDKDNALTGLEGGGEKKVFKRRGLARREEVTTWLELGRRGELTGARLRIVL